MGIYAPESLGIKPPSGGFAVGGWYNGRQFFNGTLSEPGQIHPQSEQQGAGQAVSKEVVQQTNPNNWNYIQQQQQQAQAKPVAPAGNIAPAGMPQQTSAGSTAGGSMAGFTPQASINLPELYKSLYQDSGIKASETQFSDMEKSFIEAKGKINDNPFLSEATRVGRVAKLETLFGERTANIKNDIATKKADIETQLNLQTKQFDINSQVAKDAFSQFNTLLGMGALDNASGDEIAAITRTTGISSGMIQSAIQAKQAKNVKTNMIQYDDGTNQGFAIVNENTGEIISKQVVASSKPKAESVVDQRTADTQQTQQNLVGDIQRGATLRDLVNHYAVAGGLTPEEIYRLYNSYSPYGAASEPIEDVKQGKFVS